MTKKEMFERIIRHAVYRSLLEVYGVSSMTENQAKLSDSISDKIYGLFGNNVTIKELQEKTNGETTNTL